MHVHLEEGGKTNAMHEWSTMFQVATALKLEQVQTVISSTSFHLHSYMQCCCMHFDG